MSWSTCAAGDHKDILIKIHEPAQHEMYQTLLVCSVMTPSIGKFAFNWPISLIYGGEIHS